jgi:diaminohydroxyphosphoribosylaminopyrimidine deaminase/5-amino-6-(5-phosphoribosylamino)uracil reductase
MNTHIVSAFNQAIDQAARYAGQTSPNPCVGAAALDASGKTLAVHAHERAGEGHAEANLIRTLEESGSTGAARTLIVTLEPCNHQGRTPACTEAIIRAGFHEVYFGATDPNSKVKGGGAERLRQAGIQVFGPEEIREFRDFDTAFLDRCKDLIRTFAHWSRTGRPWVTLKTAINLEGTMIPPPGQKTFTSPSSLRLAHELRKRADAILTGSGTILADNPTFTVRHVSDHSPHPSRKPRWLAILDRRGRVSEAAVTSAKANGFRVYSGKDIAETLDFLGKEGVLEVLVEAGPNLTQAFIDGGFWNQHVVIQQEPGAPDHVETRYRE